MLRRLALLVLALFGSTMFLATIAPSAIAEGPVCHKTDPQTGVCTIWIEVPPEGGGGGGGGGGVAAAVENIIVSSSTARGAVRWSSESAGRTTRCGRPH